MGTILSLTILGVSSLVTSFISGILGMAGGMILMGMLLAILPLPAAMTLHGITQFVSNGTRALMNRREIVWRIVGGYALGGLVAFAIFAAARVVLPKPAALICLGLMPFVGLALPERLHLNVERRGHSFVCGLLCVCMSLTAGIAGPILDIFFVRSKMRRHVVVATKATTQAMSHLVKIAYFGHLVSGDGAEVDGVVVVTMVVLAFAGTRLSSLVLERMTDVSFRLWTRRTVMGVGLVYIASGVVAIAR